VGLARGRDFEKRAADYLAAHGLAVLARGYRCRLGELDLVCRDGSYLVVVEVRARSGNALCSAIESIGAAKRRRIVLATRHFLMLHHEWHDRPLRFDVVAFDAIDSEQPSIQWLKNAFDGS
jgi:putative endonuclease